MVMRRGVSLLAAALAACSAPKGAHVVPIPDCPNLPAQTLAAPDTQVYDTASVSRRPSRLYSPAVHYPDSLREAGVSGRVLVEFIIDASGRAEPTSIRVVSTTHRDFAAPALEVALRSEFCPAILAGHPVRIRVLWPLNFTIGRR